MPDILSIHRYTPSLNAIDPRGLSVRATGYWRDIAGMRPHVRVNNSVHDAAGRAVAQTDPRLVLDASAPANLQTVYALSGTVLSTNSVDAGWRVALRGQAGQVVHQWDGRGSQRWAQYDTQLRPLSVIERALDGEAVCTERLSYGASDQASAEHNQCGQLIRHDDPAGTQRFIEFGLHGAVLAQARHFLRDLAMPNWPESIADRELLLEPGEGAITFSRFNAPGEAIQQTDAKDHRQLFSQTLDGQLRAVCLQLSGESTAKTLVSAIAYNAHGQTEREVAGNGVITSLQYDAADGRLTRLQAKRGNEILQDLLYAYDPVGNVLSIEDAALPIRYFANQRVEPISRYYYDTLYQMIEATGWEAGAANQGPLFSNFFDPSPAANYRQRYRYDQGGNLLELTHEGPQQHGHRLVAAAHSNRCLPVLAGVEPGEEDLRRGFDANGNLLNLQPGQALGWDLRNQLREVRPVERDSGLYDSERYVYGADGMRLRKIRALQTNARTLISEVRYLPNLELRSHSGTGEVLQVISVQAGRSSVRVLHWESAPPKDSVNNQYRYHLNDHLGSCALELDDNGEVVSQERYHPFGTTAWFAGRREVEASYRTVRYSGKERDSTGLYYYGFRYYVPWRQRWLNPDPAGSVDGLNFFVMVSNNPVALRDKDGLLGEVVFHELAMNDWKEHISANNLFGIRLQRHNKERLDYSEVNDYVVVEVGDKDYSLSRQEVVRALEGFNKLYESLEKSAETFTKNKEFHEELSQYAKQSSVLLDFARTLPKADGMTGIPSMGDRFFALIKKTDRSNPQRNILAVQKISVSQPTPKEHRAFVSGVVLNPLVSPEVRSNFRGLEGKEHIPVLQVVRTHVTVSSLIQVSNNTDLKYVLFGSRSPRERDVAQRLRATLKYEPNHLSEKWFKPRK